SCESVLAKISAQAHVKTVHSAEQGVRRCDTAATKELPRSRRADAQTQGLCSQQRGRGDVAATPVVPVIRPQGARLIAQHKRLLLLLIPSHEREGTLELGQIGRVPLEVRQQIFGLGHRVVRINVERQSLYEEPTARIRDPNWIQTGFPT